MDGHWGKIKNNKEHYKCDKCKKILEKGEECYLFFGFHSNENIAPRKCVECQESKLKEEFENLSNECFKKIFELGLKTNNGLEELSVDDYKEIKKFKGKLSQAKKKQELDCPLIKQEIKNLQNQLQELEEYASPQTKDKASSDRKIARKGNKKCYHQQIESYEDDPNYYCCSYCWESESEEFLKVLKSKGLEQGGNQPVKDNNPSYPNNNHKNSNITQKDKDMNSNLNMNTVERERERESKSNNNHLIYWTIGIIGASLIGLFSFLIIRKNK